MCKAIGGEEVVTWTHREGPDFDVCYADPVDEGQGVIGVYLGHWPQYEGRHFVRRGKVGTQRVTWYQYPSEIPDYDVGIETKFETSTESGSTVVVHVWVLARDEQALNVLVGVTEGVSIEGIPW